MNIKKKKNKYSSKISERCYYLNAEQYTGAPSIHLSKIKIRKKKKKASAKNMQIALLYKR